MRRGQRDPVHCVQTDHSVCASQPELEGLGLDPESGFSDKDRVRLPLSEEKLT